MITPMFLIRVAKSSAQIAGSGGVAFFAIESGAHQLLQMGGLGVQEKLIHGGHA